MADALETIYERYWKRSFWAVTGLRGRARHAFLQIHPLGADNHGVGKMSICSMVRDVQFMTVPTTYRAKLAVTFVTCGLCRRILEAYIKREEK